MICQMELPDMSDTLWPHTLQLLLFLWKRKESPDATVSFFFNLCKIAQELVSLIDVNFLGYKLLRTQSEN